MIVNELTSIKTNLCETIPSKDFYYKYNVIFEREKDDKYEMVYVERNKA